jgi:hypothetical protein
MLTIALVLRNGEHVEMEVQQFEFKRVCPHCGLPFKTIDPDQLYPNPSCKQRAYEKRKRRSVTASSRN